MNWVTEYCNRAMLIEKGRIVMEGSPAVVVAEHQARSAKRRAEQLEKGVFAQAKVVPPARGGR
jgi:ABC-type glutathione transport system ATPase component